MRNVWKGHDMPLSVFRKLSPAFSRTGLVYLQGWGEPLLHPEFFEMLGLVKKKGSMAGLTSNASLLSEEKIRRLAGEGLDIISLSLAGVDQVNDEIRKGTSLKKVLSAIENIHRIKASMGSSRPHIHLAYMLLRTGLGDLEKMPGFFNSLGIDQVVVSGLTLALDQEMEKEMYLADSEPEFADLKLRLLAMKNLLDEPERLFFHVFNPNLSGDECSENILKACYMNVDGFIRPCVYTDFAEFSRGFKRFVGRSSYSLESIDFGNINEQAMGKIWHTSGYATFRQDYFNPETNRPCVHCAKRFIDDLQG
jgi:MoaA/NifB/PqqE/SkfB family radical SAM enzyme